MILLKRNTFNLQVVEMKLSVSTVGMGNGSGFIRITFGWNMQNCFHTVSTFAVSKDSNLFKIVVIPSKT
jgi:hypothetical protein